MFIKTRLNFGSLARCAVALGGGCLLLLTSLCMPAVAANRTPEVQQAIDESLAWLAHTQSHQGRWVGNDGRYPTAMTALAGMAMLCEGSTTTQGKYSENLRRAVDYLLARRQQNGLIGDPTSDDRYTYGHGFSLLFLSQILGEEEDAARREELTDALRRGVEFCGRAQTKAGGWGYLSAKDGNEFDEGSTTVTQVQALRGCRNAGIPVPKEIVDRAMKYIRDCTQEDGGVEYSSKGGGGRPAITAAAVACMFSAGDYQSDYVSKSIAYCDRKLKRVQVEGFGHWHYAHYYLAQVRYRQGGKIWTDYHEAITQKLLGEQKQVKLDGEAMAYWGQGYIGPVYTTAINLSILQLDGALLPIYQR